MRALVDLLVPSVCDGCGRRAPPPWCAGCDAAVRAALPARGCPRCAAPAGPGHPCWPEGDGPRATVALTAWHDPVAALVVRAKLAGRAEVFRSAGRLLGERVVASGRTPDVVVPVPTDRRRARRRGADHALALAAGVGAALDVPVRRLVRATGPLPDRGALGAHDRRPLPVGSLAVGAAPGALGGRSVLVVDDVLTTGATVRAVLAALAPTGAAADVAVLARAGAHPLTGG